MYEDHNLLSKYSNITFHENPPSGIRVIPCGRIKGHEANSPFLQFCQRAKESGPPPSPPLKALGVTQLENNCTTLFRAAARDTVCR